MNHTRLPKEDHLPDWARRDNKVTKGDRVEMKTLHFIKKRIHTDTTENLYIYKETKWNHLNDKHRDSPNKMFEVMVKNDKFI